MPSRSSHAARGLIFGGWGQQCQMQWAIAVHVKRVDLMAAIRPGTVGIQAMKEPKKAIGKTNDKPGALIRKRKTTRRS